MNTVNVLWMYPDILNNYGDRGNIYALERVAEKLNLKVDVKRIDDMEDDVDFTWAHIILFNAGELRTCQKMARTLEKNSTFYEAFQQGKYIFAFNMTGSVFGGVTRRTDGSIIEGLGLLPMEGYEKIGVYGDDAVVIVDGFKLLGTQIQLVNYKLTDENSQFGDVIYGYGNDYLSKKEGCRKKNLIFTNLGGPLFVNNPWYCEDILRKIVEGSDYKPESSSFDVECYKDKYNIEVNSYNKILAYIERKNKPTKEKMDFFMK